MIWFPEKAKGEVKLYFQDPLELLSIFSDLEDENLALIQVDLTLNIFNHVLQTKTNMFTVGMS